MSMAVDPISVERLIRPELTLQYIVQYIVPLLPRVMRRPSDGRDRSMDLVECRARRPLVRSTSNRQNPPDRRADSLRSTVVPAIGSGRGQSCDVDEPPGDRAV